MPARRRALLRAAALCATACIAPDVIKTQA